MANLPQQLRELVDKLSPTLEKAFLDAIDDIKSEIVLREVVAKLEARDIEGAIQALHIDPAAFRPLSEALRQAYDAGWIADFAEHATAGRRVRKPHRLPLGHEQPGGRGEHPQSIVDDDHQHQ